MENKKKTRGKRISKIVLPDFIIIPYILLEDKNVSLIDERLYGIIYWFSKLKNEKCTASNETLAKLVKTTPTTIGNSLKKLEEKEYIHRVYKDTNKRNRLEIIPLVVFSKVTLTDVTKAKSLHSPVYRDTLTDVTHDTLTDEQNKNNINKNKEEEYIYAFDAFWSLYPKKKDKHKAEQKWNKLTEADRQAILDDLPKRKETREWKKEGGQYIPYPTTYLNGRRWEDDIEVIKKVGIIDLRTKK